MFFFCLEIVQPLPPTPHNIGTSLWHNFEHVTQFSKIVWRTFKRYKWGVSARSRLKSQRGYFAKESNFVDVIKVEKLIFKENYRRSMKGNWGKLIQLAPSILNGRLPVRNLPRLVTKHVNYRPTQLTPANDDKLTRAASQRIRFREWLWG